jgi:hypothetical protein
MMEFLSPDGQIGAPLQAAVFLAAIYLAVFLSLAMLTRSIDRRGPGGALRETVRTPSLIILALLALTGLNLVHHAHTPLPGVFRPEVGDGGLIENLTITLMLFLPVAFIARLLGHWPHRALGPVIMGLASLALVVAFGEEVSWGQHWFGLTPPPAIAETNLQAEINLHNYITPGVMEALYAGAALVIFLLAASLPLLLQSTDGSGLLGLKVLLLLCAVLMTHHVFQELAELAVMASAVVIWMRLETGQLEIRPVWARRVLAV